MPALPALRVAVLLIRAKPSLRRSTFVGYLLLCSAACGDTAHPFNQELAAPKKGLVIVGDLQRTNRVDELARQNEQNDRERAQIVAAIAALSPDGILNLGDLVADGAADYDWQRFDTLTEAWRRQELAMLVALGNHEYWRERRLSLGHVYPRFAALAESHWYARRYGPLALLFLDSNRQDLDADEWAAQRDWFAAQLAAAAADPEVRGILVLMHHPPFSNFALVGDNDDVQEAFLTPFAAAPKALAWLAGHVHAYERFVSDGKTFIISGGGGGPRSPLTTGDDAPHPDAFAGPALRSFHFIHLRLAADGVVLAVRGFDKGEATLRLLEEVRLAFADSD